MEAGRVRARILYYNHTRLVSGAEAMLLNLLRVLDRTLYEPIVACPVIGKGNLDELVAATGVPVIPVAVLQARFTSNPIQLFRYLASFASTIRAFRNSAIDAKPDLLHANSVRAGIVASLATVGTRIPILWHIQDDLPTHPISTLIRYTAYLSKRTRFVAVSKATARAFAGSLDFGPRLTVLYNAIDLDRFPRKTNPLDAAAQAFRDELSLTPEAFLIVSVGMINPRKGLLELLEVFRVIQNQPPKNPPVREAHLAIVGSPIFNKDNLYEIEVHEKVYALGLGGRVHFTGSRKDVPAIMRAADLFVLCARVEPFGLVIAEAMASGTPVIATDVGGVPEIVDSGRNGELVEFPARYKYRGDESIGAAIYGAMQNPETQARRADEAYQDARQRFSLARYSDDLGVLYTSLEIGKR